MVIGFGYKELNATPKVLYIGNDVDKAMEAVNTAGNKGSIMEGKIFRGDANQLNVVWRFRFEPVTV